MSLLAENVGKIISAHLRISVQPRGPKIKEAPMAVNRINLVSTLQYLRCHVSVRATERCTSRSLVLRASYKTSKSKVGNNGLVIFREKNIFKLKVSVGHSCRKRKILGYIEI